MKALQTICGALVALVLGAWMLAFLLMFAVAIAVPWMFGLPVSIKSGGKKVGYVRWFTFHRSAR